MSTWQLEMSQVGLSHRDAACLDLWAAVLRQALNDLHMPEAKQYFKSNDYYVGSFLWICDLFGLNPTTVVPAYVATRLEERRKLKEKRDAKALAKAETEARLEMEKALSDAKRLPKRNKKKRTAGDTGDGAVRGCLIA